MRETKDLEFKENITNSFLKTVSAYANYHTGTIIFGVDDNGISVGIDDVISKCLDIENKINDSIIPKPSFTLSIDEEKSTIILTVEEGINKPYFYKSKAYKRNDSSTIEVDRVELTRLILEGENSSFEETKAKQQNLTFDILNEKLHELLNIEGVTRDVLKTLELYDDKNGYNKAAELLADKNGYPGIDMVRFGESINIILNRENFCKKSIISQYDEALAVYRKYYQYEIIKGMVREKIIKIPEEAFREAVANALVHRTWDMNASINVAMYDDKIEITSPGGLPRGITKEEYLRGGISIPRNYIICNVFLRLNMIEKFGTGIRRIIEAYKDNIKKPDFIVDENTIKIILPVLGKEYVLNKDEELIFNILKNNLLSTSEIAKHTGFGKTKVLNIVKILVKEGYIKQQGTGRGTKYISINF